jgi:hypothetical protein
MFLACPQTTAPTVPPRRDLGVAQLARSSALADPIGGGARFAVGRGDVDIAAKPDDIGEAQLVEKGEQLSVAEAAIGQDRHRDALRQNLGQPRQTQVLVVVAAVLQFVLRHGQPQQRRSPAMACDEVQGERRLIVGVEICPVHRHDNLLARANDFPDPEREHLPDDDAAIAQQPIDLFDGVLVEETARLRQRMADDRDRQGSAGHRAERAAGQRLDTLGMQVACKDPREKIMHKFNAIDMRLHESVAGM